MLGLHLVGLTLSAWRWGGFPRQRHLLDKISGLPASGMDYNMRAQSTLEASCSRPALQSTHMPRARQPAKGAHAAYSQVAPCSYAVLGSRGKRGLAVALCIPCAAGQRPRSRRRQVTRCETASLNGASNLNGASSNGAGACLWLLQTAARVVPGRSCLWKLWSNCCRVQSWSSV